MQANPVTNKSECILVVTLLYKENIKMSIKQLLITYYYNYTEIKLTVALLLEYLDYPNSSKLSCIKPNYFTFKKLTI